MPLKRLRLRSHPPARDKAELHEWAECRRQMHTHGLHLFAVKESADASSSFSERIGRVPQVPVRLQAHPELR